MRAMAKNVDDRFADVMKMGDALLAILEGGQGSMATMPDMEAVDTDAVSRPNPTHAFLGQVSSGHATSEPGSQSDTAVRLAKASDLEAGLNQTDLQTNELQALSRKSGKKLLLGGFGAVLIAGLVFGLLSFQSSPKESPPASHAAKKRSSSSLSEKCDSTKESKQSIASRKRQRRKQSPLPNHKFPPKTGAVRRHVLRKRRPKSCLLKVCQKEQQSCCARTYQKGTSSLPVVQ